jgi:hypothetical protein
VRRARRSGRDGPPQKLPPEEGPSPPRNQRRKPHPSNARPGLWRGLLEWLRDGRLVAFLLAFGSALALGYLFLSPGFRVVGVAIQGNLVLPSEEAVQYSQALGTNLFLLDTSVVAQRLTTVPYVQQVQVERLLPSQVRVTIWERFPSVSWWPVANPQRYLVDNNGLVLGTEKEGMADLIYIVDLDAAPVDKQVDPEAVHTAQQVFSRLYNDLGISLYPFEYEKGRGITAVAASGWKACFGTSAKLEQKVRSLVALLQSGVQFRVVDLRIPEQLNYR